MFWVQLNGSVLGSFLGARSYGTLVHSFWLGAHHRPCSQNNGTNSLTLVYGLLKLLLNLVNQYNSGAEIEFDFGIAQIG